MDVEHVLYGFAGHANLLADNRGAIRQTTFQHAQGNVVGIINGDILTTAGQRADRFPFHHCLVELVAKGVNFRLFH